MQSGVNKMSRSITPQRCCGDFSAKSEELYIIATMKNNFLLCPKHSHKNQLDSYHRAHKTP